MNHTRKHRPWRVRPIAVPAFLLCALLAVFSSIPAPAATLNLQPGWNQITATSDFSTNSLPSNIDIFTLANGAYEPVQAADMVAGHGYWVFSPLAVSLDIGNHGASQDMVAVPLYQGWNFVGNPYAETVFSAQHITVITNGVTALFHGSDCLEPVFYTYNTTDNIYTAIPDTGALEPFRGYLVRAKADCTLVINKPDSAQNENPVNPALRRPTVRPFQDAHIAPDPGTGLDIASRELVVAAPTGMTIEDLGNRVRAAGGAVAGDIPAADMLQVVAPEGVTSADFAAQLGLVSSRPSSAANFIFESAAPDDPVFTDTDPDNDYQFTSMNAAAVLGNAAVTPWPQAPSIAILDTGIDSSHVEFTGRILPGYNFISSTENTADDNGHGTQVAGAAAAAVGNSNGSTGLCGQCGILPVKVLDANGRTTAFAVLAGIYYAADQGADVINISISGPNDHGLWERKFSEAAAYARAKGALVVVAAGNNNGDASDYLPGAAAGMFNVGAINASDERAPFSNYGNALHVSAPGVQLYTTDRGGYAWFSGTSAAAPLAAGAAGFLKLHNPDWTPEQVEYALVTTARPVATDNPLGAGVIDLAVALASSPSGGSGSSGGGGAGPGTGGGAGPGMGAAGNCTVTHNGDSGFNSLRWCIAYANTNGGADFIQFTISNTRIDLLSALPELTDPAGVTIDGSGLKIIVSGHNLINEDGLLITTPNNTIKDLSFIRFRSAAISPYAAAGIRITGNDAHDNQIIGCRLGTDYQNKTGFNNSNGIILENLAHNNVITSTTGNQTVISGNIHDVPPSFLLGGHGIYIDGAKNNTIAKSIIGAKSNGTEVLANYGSGIYITGDGADDNVIGGDTAVSMGNLISGNNKHGIYISDGDNTLIYGNSIGVDNTGNTMLANSRDGVHIVNSAKSTRVGNHNNGFRNILSGNGWSGVYVEGFNTTTNIILNNYIGVGLDGQTKMRNGYAGVNLRNAQYTYVGVDHLDVGSGNVISGNHTYGIILYGSDTQNNLIQYNKIGVDTLGNAMGNSEGGILIINDARNNKIGAKEYNKDGDNIIANNVHHGIDVRNTGSVWNKFFKNKFYGNTDLAIDLNNDGVTDNSVAAPGPNDYLDYPVITQIQTPSANCYNISGTKAPNSYAHIYYASKPASGINPDPSGHGEGYEYLAQSTTAYSASTFSYTGICTTDCRAITTIAHDANGNTSEFGHWYDLCTTPTITNVLFDPATVIANDMQKTRVTATVAYANGMQFVNTVTVNLSAVGGSTGRPLYDDGTHGDGAAGDGVYGSNLFTVAEGTSAGAKNIPLTATDFIGKSGSGAGTLTVQALALPQPCGSDWPMFSCNAANSGQSAQLFKWPLTVKWTNNTNFTSAIYTSPAIYGTHIYMAENNGRAYAINKSDGSVAWSYNTGDNFLDNAPAVWNNSVFFASKNGKIFSFNRFSGALNWTFDTGGGIRGSSPVIANDILYFGSENGTFYAIDPSTKAVVWTFSPGFGTDYSFGDAPATVVNGVVFAGNADCTIFALDAFTGEKYWERQLTTANCQVAGGGAVVSGDFVCTATWDDDRAYCLNKFTGAIEWQQYNANAFVDSNGAVYKDLFILGTGDGTLVAYDIDNGGALRWQVSLDNELAHSSPVVFNDYVYVIDGGWITDKGVLYAIDPNNNGQEVWRYNIGSFLVSNPAVSDNLLVLGTTDAANPALLAFQAGTSYNCPGWTVTTNAPSGDGSLYDCVMAANQIVGDNTITFTISNTIIRPVDPIPFQNAGGAVTVDGTGKNIVVDGTNCTLCSGFEITADNSLLKGIAVVQYRKDGRHAIDIQADNVTVDSCLVGTNFIDSTVIGNSSGIYISGKNNIVTNSVISGNSKVGITIDGTDTTGTLIEQNKIGTKSTGLASLNNDVGGLLIMGGAHNNTVGGLLSLNKGNVISGNTPGYGIRVSGAGTDDNNIIGNIIGLGSDGSTTLPNNDAVQVFFGPSATMVGGDSNSGNVISGNNGSGINASTAPGIRIGGNIIGLSKDKTLTRPNNNFGIGLYEAHNSEIGKTNLLSSNYISANGLSGIYVINTSGLSITGNYIGLKEGGSPEAGNSGAGIQLLSSATNVSIGTFGISSNVPNTIAYNGGHGIDISGSPTYSSIRKNRIYENTGKGIQTGHDYGLSIDTVLKNGSNYSVTGSSTCANCTVEIFQVDDSVAGVTADSSGAGEGYVYITSVSTSAAGAWNINLSVSANASYITATVTDTSDNTTEFAPNKLIPSSNCPNWKVTTTANSGMGSLRECLNEADTNGGNVTITFDAGIAGGTITPQTELPAFVKPNITVDGGTNNITIDGSYPCTDCHGFVLRNDGGGVKNLTIVNFNTSNKSGIVIDGQLGKGDNYVITGNKIGTDGTTAKPNKYGVSLVLGADHNTIGGISAIEGNIISGNTVFGINIIGAGSGYNGVISNIIGFASDGTTAIPNQDTGIHIGNQASYNDVIKNRIGKNGSRGVHISSSTCMHNTISVNIIYDNTQKGIELAVGANMSILPPTISTITATSPDVYNISGTTSPACPGCTIQLFRVDNTGTPTVGQDASGAGEAYAYINYITTNASGAWSFTGLTITGGDYITATVTDTNGNTSEFADNKELPDSQCPGFVVTTNANSGFGSLRQCITEANADSAASDITFHTSLANQTITLASALPTLTDDATTIKNTTAGQITINGGNNTFGCFSIFSKNNEIRGLTIVKCGNTIAGHGIAISGSSATGNLFAGNYIGVSSTGAAGLGNRTGILIQNSANNNTIGGTNAADRNIISGNTLGVNLHLSAANNAIIGNYIGTNPAGTSKVANTAGVVISNGASANTTGGTTANHRNLISGNDIGILIQGAGTDGNSIFGNYIGSNKDGNKVAGIENKTAVKIESGAQDNTIGGSTSGQANLIVYSSVEGVLVKDAGTTGNIISRNKIYENFGRGIELTTGGNNDIAAPVISSVASSVLNVYNITGTTTPACANCTIELFRVDNTGSPVVGQDTTNAGEAFAYINSATTNASGNWSLSGQTITGGNYITATVTDTSRNTSKFAANKQLPKCPGLVVTTAASSGAGSLKECITAANMDGVPSNITFQSSVGGQTIDVSPGIPALTEDGTSIKNTTGSEITLDGDNDFGCMAIQSSDNEIRGLTFTRCEWMFGGGWGLNIISGGNNVVAGNTFCTNAAGATGLGYTAGILLASSGAGNIIGGASSSDSNVISGCGTGIMLQGGSNATIYGNRFGTNASGAIIAPRNGIAISMDATSNDNTVAGTNLIVNSLNYGIHVDGGTNNTISRNRIYENGNKGIALTSGGNNSIAPPSISTVTPLGSNAYDISGTTSPACANCIIELFRVDDTATSVGQDATGAGEAFKYISFTTTNASGAWSFTNKTITGGSYITATVTDTSGNTSEFATNKELPTELCPGLVVTTNADSGVGSLRECINKSNADAVPSDITFHSSLAGTTISLASTLPAVTDDATTIENTTGGEITILASGLFSCLTIKSSDNEIRGLTVVKCGTLIGGYGIAIYDPTSTNNVIAGNFIGTNAAGALNLGNPNGIMIAGSASSNTIGGVTAADRNVIADNSCGISLNQHAANNSVIGNYIGTKPSGTAGNGNNTGICISVSAKFNTIGGDTPQERNIISDNHTGIYFSNDPYGNKVYGNYMGVDKDGNRNNMQNQAGIKFQLGAHDNIIGGCSPGQANLIVASNKEGIAVNGSGTVGNTFSCNRIYGNTLQGIKLEFDGNDELAAPSIDTATSSGANTYDISGTTSPACANCTIELFRVDDTATSVGQDATGAGEAFEFIDTATTNASGAWSFTNKTITGGSYVTATLTDTSGNTSEFAPNKELPTDMCPGFVVISTADTGFGSLRECINEANAASGNATITFSTTIANQTISIASALPSVTTNNVIIQGGAQNITIQAPGSVDVFTVSSADYAEIRNLTLLNSSLGSGDTFVNIQGGTGHIIAGNKIGNDGAVGKGKRNGILVQDASYVTIGGTTTADRNVIAGNNHDIRMEHAWNIDIYGNYIGVNQTGTVKIGNAVGISITGGVGTESHHIRIGGDTASKRNIISGSGSYGIEFENSVNNCEVAGNYIGTDVTGANIIFNSNGVSLTAAPPHSLADITIGGSNPGGENIIAYSMVYGVHLFNSNVKHVHIMRNSIFENGLEGIILINGANELIAPPSIDTVASLGSNTYNISGTTSPLCANCTVELFRVDNTGTPLVAPDFNGSGEGFEYIDSATTNALGKWSFSGKTITGGSYVTATLTDTSGNTSQFSPNRLLNGDPIITSLTSTSQDISFYEMITLAATATDPDGDPLTYEWSGGTPNPFSATTTATTNWTGPKAAYWATMTVTVRDGKGGVATGTITVRVGIKDISNINVFPNSLEVRKNNSHTFKIQAHFITGDTFLVSAESAKVKNGLGTISPTGFFQAGNTLGAEQVTFSIGDFRQVIPVNIIP